MVVGVMLEGGMLVPEANGGPTDYTKGTPKVEEVCLCGRDCLSKTAREEIKIQPVVRSRH